MKRKTQNPKKLRRIQKQQCSSGNHQCEQQKAIRDWKATNIRLGVTGGHTTPEEFNASWDRLNVEKGIVPCGPIRRVSTSRFEEPPQRFRKMEKDLAAADLGFLTAVASSLAGRLRSR